MLLSWKQSYSVEQEPPCLGRLVHRGTKPPSAPGQIACGAGGLGGWPLCSGGFQKVESGGTWKPVSVETLGPFELSKLNSSGYRWILNMQLPVWFLLLPHLSQIKLISAVLVLIKRFFPSKQFLDSISHFRWWELWGGIFPLSVRRSCAGSCAVSTENTLAGGLK